MTRKWKALTKTQEEMNELGIELMKLDEYPSGKHPRRKRSLILTTQDEIGDVIGCLQFLIDRNKLDRAKIAKRTAARYRELCKKYGNTPQAKETTKNKASKSRAQVVKPRQRVSRINQTTKTT